MVQRLGLLCESSMQNFLLVKVRPPRSSGQSFPRRQKELKVHGDDFPGEWKLSNPTGGTRSIWRNSIARSLRPLRSLPSTLFFRPSIRESDGCTLGKMSKVICNAA